MAININTPRMVPPYSESSARARSIWREEVSELRQEIAALRYRLERMERREQERERRKRQFANQPTKQHTDYNLHLPAAKLPINTIEEIPTEHELPSAGSSAKQEHVVLEPFVLLPNLPDLIIEKTEAHYRKYDQTRVTTAYLHEKTLCELRDLYQITDEIWDRYGPIKLCCDNTLACDQILCASEETEDEEAYQDITQKKPVVHRQGSTFRSGTF